VRLGGGGLFLLDFAPFGDELLGGECWHTVSLLFLDDGGRIAY
jgi:hypothetical protein